MYIETFFWFWYRLIIDPVNDIDGSLVIENDEFFKDKYSESTYPTNNPSQIKLNAMNINLLLKIK